MLRKVLFIAFSAIFLFMFWKLFAFKVFTDLRVSNLIQNNIGRDISFSQKVRAFSKFFNNTKYGHISDSELYNFQKLDCMTFVQNVLALSLSESLNDFKQKMLELNYYDYSLTRLKKKHFAMIDYIMGNDWLKYNIRFTDITDQLGRESYYGVNKVSIDRYEFLKNMFSIENEWSKNLPIINLELKYLKLEFFNNADNIKRIEQKIKDLDKDGIFLLINIPNDETQEKFTKKTKSNLDIEHLGFVYIKDDLLFLHHSQINNKVITIKFEDYFKQIFKFTKGFMIFHIKSLAR